MDRILDAGFKQPAAENVLIQSRSARAGTPAFDCRDRGRRRTPLEGGGRPNVRSPLAPATPPRSRRTATRRSSSSRSAATRTRPSTRSTPVLDGVAAAQTAHPGFIDRRVRRRERGEGRRDRVRRRPRQGGNALAPDHADRPRHRVRRARGGGDPAPARADRGLRDVRAGRAAEPRPAGRA